MRAARYLVVWGLLVVAGSVRAAPYLMTRKAADFQRSELVWCDAKEQAQMAQDGALRTAMGWVEYDFSVPQTGWYECWISTEAGWPHDFRLDGKEMYYGTFREQYDQKLGYKWQNLWLEAGRTHTLRITALTFPGFFFDSWTLRAATDDAGRGCAQLVSSNILRVGEALKFTVTGGGGGQPLAYDLNMRPAPDQPPVSTAHVSFPAADQPITKTVEMPCPQEGLFTVTATAGGQELGAGDLRIGQVVVIDTQHAPPAPATLQKTLVVDVNCATTPPYREKDGPTTVVNWPGGAYRETSGQGTEPVWATDAFSYKFDLPEANVPYLLQVDYPDNDRRTMGFWIDENIKLQGDLGAVMTGGVETGDHYRLSGKMLTHEALFWPRNNKGLIFAVVNLNHGMKAAAARFRIYKLDGPLTAGPPNHPGGRLLGYYFEEPSRWLREFGANANDLANHLLTLNRWAQVCRYTGANLMYPTINVYQDNAYPSKILQGYFNSPIDQPRLTALIAEKYGLKYVPEFHLSGNAWFDAHTMKWGTTEGNEWRLRDKNGKLGYYNALHPYVQKVYISVFGELADRLKNCPAFAGISSRLMLGWQWQGWNALPGLNWGYDDWTIAQFEKDTGIQVPGDPTSPSRYHTRFAFLTGPKLKEWEDWRCKKILAYHLRLLARIRQAKPDARLFFTYFGTAPGDTLGRTEPEKMREMGMDPAAYAKEPGIVVIPAVSFGRRCSTPLEDALTLDPMLNPVAESIGRMGGRGFGMYGAYFEVDQNMNWKALGAEHNGISFDSCMPGGRNELEMPATLLADCDSTVLYNGGNGDLFGTAALQREFLAQYKALPSLPFTPLPSGRDPVAVWYRPAPGFLWFYAVNRAPYPVTATLTLAGTTRVVSAATDETQPLAGHALTLSFQPYQLFAFRAAGDARITGCSVQVPAEEKTRLETTLRAAEKITARLRDRTLAPELTQDEAQAAEDLVTQARQAFTEGRYCRARLNLERPALIRVYDLVGLYPPGLQDRRVPRGLVVTSKQAAPTLQFAGAAAIIGDTRGKGSAVKDLAYAPDGSLWVSTPEQLMLLDAQGRYVRSLRLSPPPVLDQGDARWSSLQPPVYLTPQALRVLRDGRLAAQLEYNQPLALCEPTTGRVLPLAEGESFPLPPGQAWHLDTDATGHLYVVVQGAADTTGLYKYRPDGAADFSFGGAHPSNRLGDRPFGGVAVDAAGQIYLSDPQKNQLLVCAPDGSLVTTVDVKQDGGPRRLVVTPDGSRLYVATGGQSVVAFQRQGDQYAPLWTQALPAPVSALALGPQGQLTLGFTRPADGAVARSYTVSATGLQPGATLVPALQPDFPRYLTQATQLKAYQGAIYYLSDNQLCRLTPGNPDKVEVAYRPPTGEVNSFALAPNGDLYFSTTWQISGGKRGQWIYQCKKTATGWDQPVSVTGDEPLSPVPYAINPFDMVVDAAGRLIVRWQQPNQDDWTRMIIFARQPDGTMQRLVEVGANGANGPWSLFYGLHLDAQGRLYIAGGPTRQVVCLSPEGKELWRTGFEVHQGPGCVPLRGPEAVTTDSRGFVWLADTDGNRLECLDAEGKLAAFSGHTGGVDDRDGQSFCQPTGIATIKDAAGIEWLYVADAGNQRIIKYRIK